MNSNVQHSNNLKDIKYSIANSNYKFENLINLKISNQVYFLNKKDDHHLTRKLSYQVVNLEFEKFIGKSTEMGWSFAYTQFCPGMYKYQIEHNFKTD